MANLKNNSIKKCRKNNNDINFPETLTLPDHLIVEHILPILPVKSLIRFKCVSKFWISIISSSEFAKTHLKLSPHQFIFLTGRPFKFMLLPFNDVFNSLKIPVELAVPVDSCLRQIQFVSSSNGLVCYYAHRSTSFYVCNPAIRQCRKIKLGNSKFIIPKNWFGCVPSCNDYKIVTLSVSIVGSVNFNVFSLRTGECKMILCDIIDERFSGCETLSHETKVINDTLYLSLRNLERNLVKAKHILGFDFVTEQFKEFPLMDWLSSYTSAIFSVMNGYLSLQCQRPLDSVVDVWALKQYGNWTSWEKLISVHLPSTIVYNITPTGKFLVWQYMQEKFELVNPSRDTEEESQGDADYHCEVNVRGAGGYVESLISPYLE